MKKVFTISILALAFATGFTCSKQTPDTAPPAEMPPPAQEEMATPPPADGAAAPAPTEAPAPAPTGH